MCLQADVESNIAFYQLNNEMCGSETIDSLVTSWNKINVTEHLIQIAQNYDNAQVQIKQTVVKRRSHGQTEYPATI